jgi:hypothetical protein
MPPSPPTRTNKAQTKTKPKKTKRNETKRNETKQTNERTNENWKTNKNYPWGGGGGEIIDIKKKFVGSSIGLNYS